MTGKAVENPSLHNFVPRLGVAYRPFGANFVVRAGYGIYTATNGQPQRLVLPPTPPPELDPQGWHRTIRELERRDPQRLALVHFGVATDVRVHLAALRSRLDYWVELVGKGLSEEDFIAEAKHELQKEDRAVLDEYDRAMPFWQSYAGLKRYSDKRASR